MNPEEIPLGSITISYHLGSDGETYVNHTVDGDIHLILALGMLDMTRDSMLHPPEE